MLKWSSDSWYLPRKRLINSINWWHFNQFTVENHESKCPHMQQISSSEQKRKEENAVRNRRLNSKVEPVCAWGRMWCGIAVNLGLKRRNQEGCYTIQAHFHYTHTRLNLAVEWLRWKCACISWTENKWIQSWAYAQSRYVFNVALNNCCSCCHLKCLYMFPTNLKYYVPFGVVLTELT